MNFSTESLSLRNLMQKLFDEEKEGTSWVTKFEHNISRKFKSNYSIAVN